MPGTYSFTPPTQWTSGYTEAGAAARGWEPTTVPVELRFEGENWAEALVQHAQAAANVLPALAGPLGVAGAFFAAKSRNDAQDAAEAAARKRAEELRAQWTADFRAHQAGQAKRLATSSPALPASGIPNKASSSAQLSMTNAERVLGLFLLAAAGVAYYYRSR